MRDQGYQPTPTYPWNSLQGKGSVENWTCTNEGGTSTVKRLVTERSGCQWFYFPRFRKKSETSPYTTASSVHQKDTASALLNYGPEDPLISFCLSYVTAIFKGNITKVETIFFVGTKDRRKNGGLRSCVISIFSDSSLYPVKGLYFPFSK